MKNKGLNKFYNYARNINSSVASKTMSVEEALKIRKKLVFGGLFLSVLGLICIAAGFGAMISVVGYGLDEAINPCVDALNCDEVDDNIIKIISTLCIGFGVSAVGGIIFVVGTVMAKVGKIIDVDLKSD